ncbi:PREDICTED: uncharacterized protein LOC104610504 isoform X2 [Nelumbo nucifera]|uniref:Uncharacterized protein LOC104610504 isoform X2 n=1 Tax=Nelumbo nucifera TaxID=4432 RepID=A0A1U8BG06_NELNU|nr:PREDICTED: uncharacterized protein LOC104610504 isoform X2 [Nelumbo nucifera]
MFVEAILGIRAGPQYPKELPYIDIIESKGLDGKRQAHLLTRIQEKAHALSSCPMLVALCEEAVETLSNMNHPDGDCPLCLYPLVPDDSYDDFLPFMKLMSCFHCFHSECIIRWWKWLEGQNETNAGNSSDASVLPSRDLRRQQDVQVMKENLGNCPVCRKVFHAKDIEHVLNLVGTHSSQLVFEESEANDDELLKSDAENIRRQKFEAILKLQQENSGLIEPKRNEVLLPGMFLPESVRPPTTSTEAAVDPQPTDPTCTSKPETISSDSSNKPSTSEHKNFAMRKKSRARNPKKQIKEWVKKEHVTGE